MAWTAPMTAVVNNLFTAAQFNTHVRDNLLETAPGKATTAERLFAVSAANTIVERQISSNFISASETTTSTSYTDLTATGATVTSTTSVRAIVWISCWMFNNATNAQAWASVAVSNATTIAASDNWAVAIDGVPANNATRHAVCHVFDSLTAGSNTFTMKYRVSSGTGTFLRRELIVIPL